METKTKTIEREYAVIDGEEIWLADLIDFLEHADHGIGEPGNERHRFKRVAEALDGDCVISARRHGWRVTDEDRVSELLEEAYEARDEAQDDSPEPSGDYEKPDSAPPDVEDNRIS